MFSNLNNIDLLSVGIAIAAIGILGFIVFFNNRKSITNKTFLLFTLSGISWSIFNYINYQFQNPTLVLWFLRMVIFSAVWYCFFLFQLFYVFPKEKIELSKKYKFILIPIVAGTSIITLTNLVFPKIDELAPVGEVSKITPAAGIFLFGIVVIALIASGLIILFRKIINGQGIEKVQYRFVLIGALITFSLHIVFNFILPAFFDIRRFIPLGAVFIFPFAAFTAYAIVKHHLLNVKTIATEILTFILSVVTLFEVILSKDIAAIILRSGVFILVLAFGILLIRSVLKEVEQRERLEVLTAELEAANEKLKELDKLKSEFLSFASHQVKSPMNVVKGFATLIYDGTYGQVPDKVKETAEKIKESADRMIALVDNLLDLRKIEEGKMEIKLESTAVDQLVSEVVDELKPLADKKKLIINYNKPTQEIKTRLDPQKFRQVIQNLIENSIKYTDTGSVIINIENKDGSVLISIADTGHGIPVELLPHLFEQYQRDASLKDKIEGTGLGLFIAKQIILGHKGEIWAESEGPGKGSRFYVKIQAS